MCPLGLARVFTLVLLLRHSIKNCSKQLNLSGGLERPVLFVCLFLFCVFVCVCVFDTSFKTFLQRSRLYNDKLILSPRWQLNIYRVSTVVTVDCIYLWMHALKTCFQMASNVSISGVKLWSLADRNANFCNQNTHHKHWVRAKLYTRNDSSEPVYAYRHRTASVSQRKSLYLIFPPFQLGE